jgi:hypothetical protein
MPVGPGLGLAAVTKARDSDSGRFNLKLLSAQATMIIVSGLACCRISLARAAFQLEVAPGPGRLHAAGGLALAARPRELASVTTAACWPLAS